MALRTKFTLTVVVAVIAAAMTAPSAGAVTIESIRAGAAVTAASTVDTVFRDSSGYQVRCRHDITIPTTAFTGTSSVSIEAADNVYSNCRDNQTGTCIVRSAGRWTITATSLTSGTIRLDSNLSIDCTSRVGTRYSCVLSVDSGQSLVLTFTNPVSPATTGTLSVDSPNSIRYTITAATNCQLGGVGTRGTATQTGTFSTENVRVVR